MIGFKAFDKDLKCRGFQYEIGKEYEMDGEVIICQRGFHFCENLADCYNYYPTSEDTRICKVEAYGEIKKDEGDSKCVTNKIRILEEILNPREKSNTGSGNSGYCNSGNRNSGDCNSGDWNSGDRNSGNSNSGDRNSGNWNSGNWNSGNRNNGIFCTDKNPKIKIFDTDSDWTMQDWCESKACKVMCACPYTYSDFIYARNMTAEEKEKHPEYETIGGYVKVFTATAEDKQKWWDNLTKDDKEAVMSLPNFDKNKFKSCTEISC